jgi:hypothetical protein
LRSLDRDLRGSEEALTAGTAISSAVRWRSAGRARADDAAAVPNSLAQIRAAIAALPVVANADDTARSVAAILRNTYSIENRAEPALLS